MARSYLEQYESGCYAVHILLSDDDVDTLMRVLPALKGEKGESHFHIFRTDYGNEGDDGRIINVEFHPETDTTKKTMDVGV